MNIQKMALDLGRLRREWDRQSDSRDILGNRQWVQGVAFGVGIVCNVVQQYLASRRRPRRAAAASIAVFLAATALHLSACAAPKPAIVADRCDSQDCNVGKTPR